ncbi:MAG TPA: hypothetical protein PKI64_09220 [Kiritimatiellia bacterium]|jgi:hypothetical protein|nr:hypothetical protein [Kiritimatiellia bacterium]
MKNPRFFNAIFPGLAALREVIFLFFLAKTPAGQKNANRGDFPGLIVGLERSQTFQPFPAGRFHSSTIPALQKQPVGLLGTVFFLCALCVSARGYLFVFSRQDASGAKERKQRGFSGFNPEKCIWA